MELQGIFKQMYEAWDRPIVVRTNKELEEYTFGLLKKKSYLANLDSLGKGPKSKENFGSKVLYQARDFAEWMQERYLEKDN